MYQLQGEGNVTVYLNVFMRYTVTEMLLCRVMCA